MSNKTGPKPKPKNKHYKVLTITLPPELHEALMTYKGNDKLSPTVAKLIQAGLNYVFLDKSNRSGYVDN